MSQHITHNSIRAGTVDDNFTFLDNSGNSNPITQPSTHPPTPANMSTHLGSAHIDPADNDTPASMLRVSALHYSTGIGNIRGFQTLASARVLHLTTYYHVSEYF